MASTVLYILRAGPSLRLRIEVISDWVNNRNASPSICYKSQIININSITHTSDTLLLWQHIDFILGMSTESNKLVHFYITLIKCADYKPRTYLFKELLYLRRSECRDDNLQMFGHLLSRPPGDISIVYICNTRQQFHISIPGQRQLFIWLFSWIRFRKEDWIMYACL